MAAAEGPPQLKRRPAWRGPAGSAAAAALLEKLQAALLRGSQLGSPGPRQKSSMRRRHSLTRAAFTSFPGLSAAHRYSICRFACLHMRLHILPIEAPAQAQEQASNRAYGGSSRPDESRTANGPDLHDRQCIKGEGHSSTVHAHKASLVTMPGHTMHS